MTEAPFSTLTRAAADDLERVLARLEWTLLDFEQRELAAGTAVSVAGGRIRFHYVVSGSVQLTGGAAPLRLEAGDFLMLPQSEAHRIRAERDSVVASGELDAATVPGLPLASALPASLTACGFVVREPHMGPLIQTLGLEFGGMRAGNCLMASRIATIIATAAVRSWVENGCASDQWLVSVRDPHIARAVAAMREAPGEPWTVDRLARVASASRTVFAERFRELVGDSPSRYLATVRVEQAAELLRDEGVSIGEVAHRLGYGSDVAFSRAFRRVTGVSPAAWRRGESARSAAPAPAPALSA
ncbi:helix-turn-helix domain-containing protein [Leifsonia sp. RAF41]|uniref:helix-turn-helix domain-containing protein n=1 Tax=Leifsonia sp. RAF41 TaxID=3233056 RepID=UPI003F9DB060